MAAGINHHHDAMVGLLRQHQPILGVGLPMVGRHGPSRKWAAAGPGTTHLFVVVVFISGLVKLGFVVFGCALLYPDTIRVPRWLRLAFGWVSGVLLMAYGLVGSAPGIIKLLAGESLSRYGWWRIFLWMPHFWVGGILVLAATVAYQRWSKANLVTA